MDLFSTFTDNLQFYLAALVRTSGVIIAAPIIGGKETPRLVKVGLVCILTLVIAPTLSHAGFLPAHDLFGFAAIVVRELAVGLGISFVALLTFGALQIAGEFVGRQMGFAMAQVVNPLFGQQTSIVSRFNVVLGSLILLTINGHHWFIQALGDSFARIPVNGLHWSPRTSGFTVELFASIYFAGIKLAAPLICASLLITVAVGILARIAPQLNVMMLSISLRIGAGLIGIGLFMPYFAAIVQRLFMNMRGDIYMLLEVMKG